MLKVVLFLKSKSKDFFKNSPKLKVAYLKFNFKKAYTQHYNLSVKILHQDTIFSHPYNENAIMFLQQMSFHPER